jgi:CBS domain-containing protein
LTAIFLLTEMTGSYDVTLPALISSILALVVARAIEPESIDTYALARRGINLDIDKDRLALARIQSQEVMNPQPAKLNAKDGLQEIFTVAEKSGREILPVVNSEGGLMGVIAARNLVGLLLHSHDLMNLVNAADVCRHDFPTVTTKSSLEDAMHLMEDELTGELPVIDDQDHARLVGTVSRHDIEQALSRATGSVSLLIRHETNIFWSSEYRVARIRIPPGAKGKTLRALNTRARFGVNVLAIQSGSDPMGGFSLIDPDQSLTPGDLVIAAGRSAGLRAFERDLRGD